MEKDAVKDLLEAGMIKSFSQIFTLWRYSRRKLVRETDITYWRLKKLISYPEIMSTTERKMIAEHFEVRETVFSRLFK